MQKETDKLYIEFIESLDMCIPENDCTDYRDQNDYKAMEFALEKIKNLEECISLLTEVDGLLFRVSYRFLRHSKDPVAQELRKEIREFKAKL